jgi:glycosyltransferase involved in cell wall biosynthesis
MQGADYMIVLPTQHFRLDDHHVALESAFAHHLRLMRSKIGNSAKRLVIVSPGMAAAQYQSVRQSLDVLDERTESLLFFAPYSIDQVQSRFTKLRLFLPLMRTLRRLVRQSFCVHSGLSWDWMLPTEFASLIFGMFQGRRTVFIVDIDYRNSARMSYLNGSWSLKSYLACKYIYDPARWLQVWFAVRRYSLVMLKGNKMAADFGRGRANVRSFLDAAHSEHNIIDADALRQKLDAIRSKSTPLKLTYFGRITAYKGIDACLRAVVAARRAGALVTLDIIGAGEQADFCRSLSRELDAEEFVTFRGPMQFGPEFFHLLYGFHLLLAAPLREDTPRSALDAMAAGIPYLAYDTYYYKQLLESGAGEVVPWLDEKAMTAALIKLDSNREDLVRMAENAVTFAQLNTQEIWLDRRLEWTLGLVPSESSVR